MHSCSTCPAREALCDKCDKKGHYSAVCHTKAINHHFTALTTLGENWGYLFELNKSTYLIVIDYFSSYPEFVKLTSTTSKGVIADLKSMFSCHYIPAQLVSDNGSQFISRELQEFAEQYSLTQYQ